MLRGINRAAAQGEQHGAVFLASGYYEDYGGAGTAGRHGVVHIVRSVDEMGEVSIFSSTGAAQRVWIGGGGRGGCEGVGKVHGDAGFSGVGRTL